MIKILEKLCDWIDPPIDVELSLMEVQGVTTGEMFMLDSIFALTPNRVKRAVLNAAKTGVISGSTLLLINEISPIVFHNIDYTLETMFINTRTSLCWSDFLQSLNT